MNKIVYFAFMTLLLSVIAEGRTLYLSPGGDDSAEPVDGAVFQTFKAVLPHLWMGDTLIVKKGVYEGGFNIRRGAHPDAPLTIIGEEGAIIKGSGDQDDAIILNDCEYVIIDGLSVTGAKRAGIYLDHGKNIIIRNCHAYDNGRWGIFTNHTSDFILEGNECSGSRDEHGIYHSNSGDDFIIRNNIVHSNAANGIHLNGDPAYGGDGVIQRGIIENNIIYNNGTRGGAAINMASVQDVIVRNNLIYHNKSAAITFYQDHGTISQRSQRALIINNTIYFEPDQGRSPVFASMTAKDYAVFNNIIVSGQLKTMLEINAIDLPTIFSDHNLYDNVDTDKALLRYDGSWTNPEGLINHARMVQGFYERSYIRHRKELSSLEDWRRISGNDHNSLFESPGFVSLEDRDFSLRADSPAIGIGIDATSIRRLLARFPGYEWILQKFNKLPDIDMHGQPRNAELSQRAIGAIEYIP